MGLITDVLCTVCWEPGPSARSVMCDVVSPRLLCKDYGYKSSQHLKSHSCARVKPQPHSLFMGI